MNLREKIQRELDELMMGAENYFGAINPKRDGHIHCAMSRIEEHLKLQPDDIEKMRAYHNAGGLLMHWDVMQLIAEIDRLREALQDIRTSSGRARVLEITKDALRL